MTTAVIFDLDNCLSAGCEAGEEVYRPGFDAIRNANNGTLCDDALERAFSDCWRYAIDDVARRHRFSREMKDAAMRAFAEIEVDAPMSGYSDLHLLAELPVLRFLVTSGFRRLQESKIRALGFKRQFTGTYVDAIDELERKGKEGIFREILTMHSLTPGDVVVVGDNPDSEIAAGNRLGCRTVQILRPGVERGENAWRFVESLHELKVLITAG